MIWVWNNDGEMRAQAWLSHARSMTVMLVHDGDEWAWFVLDNYQHTRAQAIAWGHGATKAEVFHACMAELYAIADRSGTIIGARIREQIRTHENACFTKLKHPLFVRFRPPFGTR